MIIPERVYRLVERKLMGAGRLKATALSRAEEARARAMYPRSSMPMPTDGSGDPRLPDAATIRAGHAGNSTERKIIEALSADSQVETAEKWEAVIRKAFSMYPPSSPEGAVAKLYYRDRFSQSAICGKLSIDRQTVRRRRDAFVVNTALLAAAAGLIRMSDPGDESY